MKGLRFLAISLVVLLFVLAHFCTPAAAQISTNTPSATVTPQATAAATEPAVVVEPVDAAIVPTTSGDQLPSTFGGFLTFLGTVGAIGAVLSWIAENWAYFQRQSAQGKMLILLIISTVMGLISMFAVEYIPAGVIADAEPFYRVIVASIGIVLSSQLYHGVAQREKPTVIKTETTTTSSSISKSAIAALAVDKSPSELGAKPADPSAFRTGTFDLSLADKPEEPKYAGYPPNVKWPTDLTGTATGFVPPQGFESGNLPPLDFATGKPGFSVDKEGRVTKPLPDEPGEVG